MSIWTSDFIYVSLLLSKYVQFMKKTENVKFHAGHKLQWWHVPKYKFLPANFSIEHKAHGIVHIHEKC